MSIYRNSEGYADPTAGRALGKIAFEERRARRDALAPHLLFPQFMFDATPNERGLALRFGIILMDKCDEVWIFGSQLSTGMRAEHDRALKKGYRIRYFTADCMELTREGASQLYGKEPSNDR